MAFDPKIDAEAWPKAHALISCIYSLIIPFSKLIYIDTFEPHIGVLRLISFSALLSFPT